MRELAEKFRQVEQQVAAEKGPFWLFALFLREDAPGLWDLLISAPWIEANKEGALRYIVPKLQAVATPKELVQLSRIAIIEVNQPELAAIRAAIHVEHGLTEVRDTSFFGLEIKHAYFITARNDG